MTFKYFSVFPTFSVHTLMHTHSHIFILIEFLIVYIYIYMCVCMCVCVCVCVRERERECVYVCVCVKKKQYRNYTRILWAVFNKFQKQQPTKRQLYGHLPPISQTIQDGAGPC